MDRLTIRNMELKEAIEHAREVAEHCDADNLKCAYQHNKLADWLDELQIYQQARDKGLLIQIPCKVGDVVYVLIDGSVKEEIVKMVFFDNDGKFFHTLGDFCGGVYRFSDVGKRVFLSREKAVETLGKKEK